MGGIMLIADKSIKVTKKTKERLEFLKIIPQEPFGAVINRLLDLYDQQEKNKKD